MSTSTRRHTPVRAIPPRWSITSGPAVARRCCSDPTTRSGRRSTALRPSTSSNSTTPRYRPCGHGPEEAARLLLLPTARFEAALVEIRLSDAPATTGKRYAGVAFALVAVALPVLLGRSRLRERRREGRHDHQKRRARC